ncbi:hypothetical protein BDY19DRAFT_857522, partial [Irpex rosettiformis]
IQRPLKHAIRKAAHKHVVDETLAKLDEGQEASEIRLDKTIGTMRDRSVEWMIKGYEAINDPEFVRKAWEKCAAGEYNLSRESLTSPGMRSELNKLAQTDATFFAEITSGRSQNAPTDLED